MAEPQEEPPSQDSRGAHSSIEKSYGVMKSEKHLQGLDNLDLVSILATVAFIIATVVLGVGFIVWLLLHRASSQPTLSAIWKDGAFLVDESSQADKGGANDDSIHLTGLTISTVASKVVSFCTQFVMGLYAFRMAKTWLSEKPGSPNHPTPLQYGLLVELLHAPGVRAVWDAFFYLCREIDPSRSGKASLLRRIYSHVPWKRTGSGRSPASPILISVFCVSIGALFLAHTIDITDIWLHSVTTTVKDVIQFPMQSPMTLSFVPTGCDLTDSNDFCLICCYWDHGGDFDGVDAATDMLTAANNSNTYKAITLADASDMAVLTNTILQPDVAFRASSIGARASCTQINHLCGLPNDFNGTCAGGSAAGVPSNYPPFNGTHPTQQEMQPGFVDSPLIYVLSTNADNESQAFSPQDFDGNATLLQSETPHQQTGAYKLWLQFVWVDSDAHVSTGEAVDNFGDFLVTMLVNCSLSFYNVTVDYESGNYTLFEANLTDTSFADILSIPTRTGFYANNLIANIQGFAYSANTSQGPMPFLQQDLARLAIGSAAFAVAPTGLTLRQSELVSVTLARYPLWPIVIEIALLFANAIFGLFVLLSAVFLSSEELIVGDRKNISSLRLVQLRLTSMVAVIAGMFPTDDQKGGRTRAELSTETDTIEMFKETGDDDRLAVGLTPDDLNGYEVFGVFQGVPRARSYIK